MKKLILSICLALVLTVSAVPVFAAAPDTARLIADGRGDATDVGALTLDVSTDTITVTFTIDETATELLLDEAHLYVADTPPAKHSPGKFPYKTEDLGGVLSVSFNVPVSEADVDSDGIVYVAAHAALIMQDGVDPDTGDPVFVYESSWAQVGENDLSIGKGSNWATCFEVDLTQ
jgi:hypothetical protein